MAFFNIRVSNRSQKFSNFIISQEPPSTGDPSGTVWPLVISKAGVPHDSVADFSIQVPNPYYAYAISSQGKPGHGASVKVTTKLPVTLGSKGSDGQRTPGTTVLFSVINGAPTLRVDNETSDGFDGAFEIRTSDDFTDNDAKNHHYLIGCGSEQTAWAAFVPQPNTKYQIQPQQIFYLSAANHMEGTLVDVDTFSDPLKLDFGTLPSKRVNVTQTETGELVIDPSQDTDD